MTIEGRSAAAALLTNKLVAAMVAAAAEANLNGMVMSCRDDLTYGDRRCQVDEAVPSPFAALLARAGPNCDVAGLGDVVVMDRGEECRFTVRQGRARVVGQVLFKERMKLLY